MESLTFESSDVGLVEATVSSLYSRMRIGAVGAHTRARITRHVMTPEIGFDELDYSFDIGYAAEPPDMLIICDVISRTIRRTGEQGEETFGPGDEFLISQPGLPYSGVAHAPRLRFTILDPGLLTRVAAASKDDAAEPVRMLDHRPVSRQAALNLQRSIAYVRDDVMAYPEASLSPLVVSTAGQYLAASVLRTFPNNAVTALTSRDGRDANPTTVQRAVAFMEANPGLDLTLTDIAHAAYVTPRALQLAFRRHLDTTPMAYLRRVRLNCAHHDLQRADPTNGQTVAAIATRWGFAHAGRFASTYSRVYGQSPSHTLHS